MLISLILSILDILQEKIAIFVDTINHLVEILLNLISDIYHLYTSRRIIITQVPLSELGIPNQFLGKFGNWKIYVVPNNRSSDPFLFNVIALDKTNLNLERIPVNCCLFNCYDQVIDFMIKYAWSERISKEELTSINSDSYMVFDNGCIEMRSCFVDLLISQTDSFPFVIQMEDENFFRLRFYFRRLNDNFDNIMYILDCLFERRDEDSFYCDIKSKLKLLKQEELDLVEQHIPYSKRFGNQYILNLFSRDNIFWVVGAGVVFILILFPR